MNLRIRILVGAANPHKETLEEFAGSRDDIEILSNQTEMLPHMCWSDIVISGAGTTCWELCYLGKPTALVITAENQRASALALTERGAAVLLGDGATMGDDRFACIMDELINDPDRRQSLADISGTLVDGRGVERVISVIQRRQGN